MENYSDKAKCCYNCKHVYAWSAYDHDVNCECTLAENKNKSYHNAYKKYNSVDFSGVCDLFEVDNEK